MIRLGISVEGATEREFVNRSLRLHLLPFGVQVSAIDLRGNVSLDKIASVMPALLASFDRVTTLYDFYGFKGRDGRTVDEMESSIAQLVSAEHAWRLIAYIQLYEFEALLFAVPHQVIHRMAGTDAQRIAMQDAVRRSGSPEAVNGSFETSPSHRIKTLFSGFDKKLHGPDILIAAGLDAVRTDCPRFDAWLKRLENLQ